MEIKDIIGKKGIFEMVYTKLDGTTTCYYIADVQLSGKDYIKAYSCKSPKQLTFKIERIWDVQETWIALNKGGVAPQSGVYVFVYEGDNHLDFEAFQLVKGEELLKYLVMAGLWIVFHLPITMWRHITLKWNKMYGLNLMVVTKTMIGITIFTIMLVL